MRKTALYFIEHGIENFSARNFCRFLLHESIHYFQVLALGKFFRFMQLRFQTQNLAVFLISAFSDVEKIFYWLLYCVHIFWRGLMVNVRRGNEKSPQFRRSRN